MANELQRSADDCKADFCVEHDAPHLDDDCDDTDECYACGGVKGECCS